MQQNESSVGIVNYKDSTYIMGLLKKAEVLENAWPDSAMKYNREALLLSRQYNYPLIELNAFTKIGYLYRLMDKYDLSIRYFEQGIPIALKHNLPAALINIYNNIAATCFVQGAFYQSIRYNYKALAIIHDHKEIPRTRKLITVYADLGNTWNALDNFEFSTRYLDTANTLALLQKDTNMRSKIALSLGNIYYNKGEVKTSQFYFDRALQLWQLRDGLSWKVYMQTQLGTALVEGGYTDSGMALLNRALQLGETLPANRNNKQIPELYLAHAFFHTGQYKKANTFLNSVMHYSMGIQDMPLLLEAYDLLGRSYAGQGNYREAYTYRTEYIDLKDSLQQKERKNTVNFILELKAIEKNKELAQQQLLIVQQKNRIQQLYLWAGAAVIFILVLTVMLIRKRHKTALNRIQAQVEGAEKERVRLARELHDGVMGRFSLARMQLDALSHVLTDDEAVTGITRATEEMEQGMMELRYVTHNLLPEILQQAGLEEALMVYCRKVSNVGPLKLSFQAMGALPQLNDEFSLHLYRIVQELVQNMIKHSGATKALLQLNAHDGGLEVTLEDNGNGRAAGRLPKEGGIGLANLKSRIQLLNGTFSIDHHQGTSVYMEFDLQDFVNPEPVTHKD